MTAPTAAHFHDKTESRKYLEAVRGSNGPVGPHCGVEGAHYAMKAKTAACKTAARPGLYKCRDCRKQFSATVGTVFERSKIPLTKWLMAAYLMCSSKKGISAHQLYRILGVTYKTAWFLARRIRGSPHHRQDVRRHQGRPALQQHAQALRLTQHD